MTARQDTRERILDVARELFLAQGYAATGVAQILKGAEAKSGSLYYFYPTKEDLLLAVLEWYKQNLWPQVIEPVFGRVSDPIERIFGVLHGYRQMLIYTGCAQGCPIGNLALELSDSHPAARQMIADNFTGWRNAIKLCIEAALDRMPEGTDPDDLASFVLTVMEGGMMQAKAYKNLEPFETAIAQLRDYFDRLLSDGTSWSAPPRGASAPSEVEPEPTDPPTRQR